MKRLLLASALVLLAACSGGAATQYVGTVMNEAAPEAEGTLRLTLYSRTDTSFTGVIELGAPAHGTGSVYAWPEGAELHIVSVGAESGDTIRWFSRLSDAGLGGRYEVIGGERTGQRGTWRAALVAGPPATQATLRTPAGTPAPPLSALVPIAILVALGIAGWRWILAAPRAVTADGSPWRAPASPLAGIGGWLALFALSRAVGVMLWFTQFPSAWEGYGGSMGIGAAVSGMRPMVVLETTMAFLLLPLSVAGLILLARRSVFAPRYWLAALVLIGGYALVDIVAMLFIHPALERLVGAEAFTGKPGGAREQNLRQIVYSLIWSLYWVNSQRVRATFGAAALDRAVSAPSVAPAEATPVVVAAPAAPTLTWWRRWRVVLWIAGAVVASSVALFTLALRSVRVTPYAVPQGTDIRAAVAGRWAWGSDSAGCDEAHTIAFAEKGKVMTITSGSPGDADPVTTYDILRVTRTSIRGAIRGETRMTSEGKPVVWDLVLTGPDEYRWHRTDWREDDFSYTGAIHRCPAEPGAAEAADSASGAAR